jgi:hypothetical protein
MCDERKFLSLSSPMPMGSYLTLEGTISVVATDTASVNADCDNGAVALYSASRYRRCGGDAASWLAEVARPHEEATAVSTAFRWAHASWDNAEPILLRPNRIGWQGGSERSALAARFSDNPVLLRTAIWAQP